MRIPLAFSTRWFGIFASSASLGVAYFVAAYLGKLLSGGQAAFTTFWPPSGIYVAVLAFNPCKKWPWLVAGAVAGNLSFDLFCARPLSVALLFACGNTIEAVAGAALLRLAVRGGGVPSMSRLRDVAALVLLAACLSTALSATCGAFTVSAILSAGRYWQTWFTWWSSDALSVLAIGPFALLWGERICQFRRRNSVAMPYDRVWETVAWGGVFTAVVLLILFTLPGWHSFSYTHMIWPVLIWGALRLSTSVLVTANLALACAGAWAAGLGLLPTQNVNNVVVTSLVDVQVFIALAIVVSLLLHALAAERTSMQRQLQRSNELLGTVTETTDVLIAYMDRNYDFLHVNKAYADAGRKNPAEFIGRNHFELYPDEDVRRLFEQVVHSGTPLTVTARPFFYPDQPQRGTTFWDWSLVPVFESGRRVKGLVFSLRDVSARVAAGQAEREHAELLQQTQRVARMGHYSYDILADRWRASDVLDEIFGIDAAYERTAAGWLALVHPEQRAELEQYLKAEIVDKSLAFDREFRIVRASDGAVRWVHGLGRIERGPDERVVRLMGTVQDITQRRISEEQLLLAQRMDSLGKLAGGIAHDFNNLLSGIFGYVEFALLHARAGGDTAVASALERATDVFGRARTLTRQLLTFAKGGEPVRRVMSIEPVLREAIRISTSGSSVRCELSVPPDIWSCRADENQMVQVFSNIILNAVQAMPGGGRIEITAVNCGNADVAGVGEVSGLCVRVSVRDNGPGIPPATTGRIFEPFFSTKTQGTGLGLATAYSIIARHKGRIDVESSEAGAVFHVSIPAANAPADIQAVEAAHAREPRGNGRILVMDDEDYMLDSARIALASLGYHVVVARNGEQAMDRIRDALSAGRTFDLAILDLTVAGGMGGVETVRELQSLMPSLKALASSGYSEDPVMSEPQTYGFCGSLPKPYRRAELARAVCDALASGPAARAS